MYMINQQILNFAVPKTFSSDTFVGVLKDIKAQACRALTLIIGNGLLVSQGKLLLLLSNVLLRRDAPTICYIVSGWYSLECTSLNLDLHRGVSVKEGEPAGPL